MKITQEQIEKIKKLREEGKSQKEISEILNIPKSTVQYWFSEEIRKRKIKRGIEWYKNLSEEKKKELNERRKGYRRNYYKNKYHNDEEYRKKRIEWSKNWKKK